jgi:hypothetical protein
MRTLEHAISGALKAEEHDPWQAKYVGTGHADTTKFEWAVNQHRDSYAAYIGWNPSSAFFSRSFARIVSRLVSLPFGSPHLGPFESASQLAPYLVD